jgi:glycosyltransferase involved in cell wall biosynthesis
LTEFLKATGHGGCVKQPLGDRVLVIMQGGLYRQGPQCYMKEVWWDYLLERLVPLFRTCVVASPVTTEARGRFQAAAMDEPRVRTLALDRRACTVARLARCVREADLVWIFMPTMRGLAVGLLCGAMRVPYVAYLGSDISLIGGRVPAPLRTIAYRRVLKRAAAVITAGNQLLQSALPLNPGAQATVPATKLKPHHLRETAESARSPIGGTVRWLYVGNLHRRKRPDVLLRAYAAWCRSQPATGEFHLAGGDPSAELLHLAATLGVADTIQWHGYVSNGPKLFDLYRQSDVFVLASESEGFPRVLYEAMAFGVPIVTTPVSGVPYLLDDRIHCLMVPMANPQAMAQAVLLIQSDPALSDALVSNALALVGPIVAADGAAQVRRVVQHALPVGAR